MGIQYPRGLSQSLPTMKILEGQTLDRCPCPAAATAITFQSGLRATERDLRISVRPRSPWKQASKEKVTYLMWLSSGHLKCSTVLVFLRTPASREGLRQWGQQLTCLPGYRPPSQFPFLSKAQCCTHLHSLTPTCTHWDSPEGQVLSLARSWLCQESSKL